MPVIGGGKIRDYSFSKAWGVNPSAASGTAIGMTLAVGNYVQFSFTAPSVSVVFYGVVSEVGETNDFGQGTLQPFTVLDNRVRLGWQMVFGAWNIEDDVSTKRIARPVSPSTGAGCRRPR